VDSEEKAPPSNAPPPVSPTLAHLPSAGSRASPDVDWGHSTGRQEMHFKGKKDTDTRRRSASDYG